MRGRVVVDANNERHPEPTDFERVTVQELLGIGFCFSQREDYDLALEWAVRAYRLGCATGPGHTVEDHTTDPDEAFRARVAAFEDGGTVDTEHGVRVTRVDGDRYTIKCGSDLAFTEQVASEVRRDPNVRTVEFVTREVRCSGWQSEAERAEVDALDGVPRCACGHTRAAHIRGSGGCRMGPRDARACPCPSFVEGPI